MAPWPRAATQSDPLIEGAQRPRGGQVQEWTGRRSLRASAAGRADAVTTLPAQGDGHCNFDLDAVAVRADDADYVTPLVAFFGARARRRG